MNLRCAIVDRGLAGQAARLAAEGVDFIQLRDKMLPAGELASLARAILRAVRNTPTRLLINGRADVAIATGAHGVHLTSAADELKPLQIRGLYAQAGLAEPVITASCHTLEEVVRQRLDPVTAILFGPVFEKAIAGRTIAAGTGLDLLREACAAAAPIPVLALGGITIENTPACIEAGASGVAGIRLFHRG